MSEYTPTTDEVRETYERARYYLDDMPEEGDSYRAGRGEFDRWITAHDRELRERIAREIEVMLIGSDAGCESEVIAVHDSALSRAARIARDGGRINRCWWCGKERRHFSDWEQRPLGGGKWMRLCETCATKRLNNPLSGLLGMRKIGDDNE